MNVWNAYIFVEATCKHTKLCLSTCTTLHVTTNVCTFYSFYSVLDVSHNRIDDPDVVEVFESMENLVS